jgi:hypothetical protein
VKKFLTWCREFAAWKGNKARYDARCPEGHSCWPKPNHVFSGVAACRECAVGIWDTFYVVLNRSAGQLKFGITQRDGRVRLAVHARAGFDEVYLLLTGVPNALALENWVRKTLEFAEEKPVLGREYFAIHNLSLVDDAVRGWGIGVC